MDFYRLNDKTNIYDLDIIESFENAISIIEWPEKLIEFIPEKRLNIKLSFVDDILSKTGLPKYLTSYPLFL